MTARGETLADRVRDTALSSIGSTVHLQAGAMIAEARKVRLDRPSAEAVRTLLVERTWTVECALDALPPMGPTWIEWPFETVSGHGGGERAETGVLVAPHPADPDLLAFLTGWDAGEGADLCYGVAIVSRSRLTELSWHARRFFSRDGSESLARMMSCVSASIPPGFADEVDAFAQGVSASIEDAHDRVLRDATGEVPFALAVLVASVAEGGLDLSDDGSARLGAPAGISAIERAMSRIGRGPGEGIVGRRTRSGVKLRWLRAA